MHPALQGRGLLLKHSMSCVTQGVGNGQLTDQASKDQQQFRLVARHLTLQPRSSGLARLKSCLSIVENGYVSGK